MCVCTNSLNNFMLMVIFLAAKDNGSPIPVPYRSLGKEKSSDSGVNFASGGCGILDWTHPPDFPSVITRFIFSFDVSFRKKKKRDVYCNVF